MFKRSTTSECGVTQHTTTTIQYERYNTDGAKICSRKQRTKYDRRYDEEANRARRRGSVSGKPERHTRENFHTHYDSSPLTFGRHEEPMRNLFCTRNKKIETRRKISQSATICRIFLGGKLARSRSSSSSTQDYHNISALLKDSISFRSPLSLWLQITHGRFSLFVSASGRRFWRTGVSAEVIQYPVLIKLR